MNYTCPYCGHHSTLQGDDSYTYKRYINVSTSTLGETGFVICAITCPNKNCREPNINFKLANVDAYNEVRLNSIKHEWQLLPESQAIVLPSYIPSPIQDDYYEACRIRDLSPKASATLARRCLQGMIRDFFGLSRGTLKEEINSIKDKVDESVFAAIEAVRRVGNIGAHMEKDINLIVDVEPNEAQLLIELIEQLVDDWYVARRSKEDRLAKITALAQEKSAERRGEITN